MKIKRSNVYIRESEKMEELDECLSRFGEVTSEGRKYQRRIFLTRDDLPVCDVNTLIGMINRDVSKLKLSNLKLSDKKHYFHFQSASMDRNGELIPYIDIEFVKSYDKNQSITPQACKTEVLKI